MFFDGVQRLPHNFWRRITWRCVNRPCFWVHTEVCSQHGFKRTQTMFSRQLNGWERGQTLSPRTRDRADVPPSALRLPVVCCCFAPTEWLPMSPLGSPICTSSVTWPTKYDCYNAELRLIQSPHLSDENKTSTFTDMLPLKRHIRWCINCLFSFFVDSWHKLHGFSLDFYLNSCKRMFWAVDSQMNWLLYLESIFLLIIQSTLLLLLLCFRPLTCYICTYALRWTEQNWSKWTNIYYWQIKLICTWI